MVLCHHTCIIVLWKTNMVSLRVQFELLENVAIFRLKPILCIDLDHVLFLKKMTALSSLH